MLLLVAVAENHRIIQRQRQLQNAGHRIGHKGNLTQQEVGAQIHDHGHHKSEDQHRHLGIGLGCEQQHQHDDHCHINHDHTDLAVNGLLLSVAKLRGDIDIIRRKSRLDGLQTGEAFLIRFIVVEGNGIQCRHIVVVVLGVVVLHPLYPFDPGDLIF